MIIRLELPWPVSANNLHFVSGRRKVLTPKGRQHHAAVAAAVAAAGSPRMPEGRLEASLFFYPPDRRARDIANFEKATIDGVVQAGVIEEDSLIDAMHLYRRQVVKGGMVVVLLEPYTEDSAQVPDRRPPGPANKEGEGAGGEP